MAEMSDEEFLDAAAIEIFARYVGNDKDSKEGRGKLATTNPYAVLSYHYAAQLLDVRNQVRKKRQEEGRN